MMNARLTLTGITKKYPSVVANDGVSLTVQPGEIHAVLGENGAGKSTLMKIIYGAVKPDAGQVLWNGSEVAHRQPGARARQLGIAMVFQHFSLFDTLTVTENIALGLPSDTKLDTLATRITEPPPSTAWRWSRSAMCIRCRSANASGSRSSARC